MQNVMEFTEKTQLEPNSFIIAWYIEDVPNEGFYTFPHIFSYLEAAVWRLPSLLQEKFLQ